MKKRILTIVLALIMVCSLLPVTAMALDDTLTVAGTNVVSGANITYWLCNNDGTITSSGASESNYNVKYDPTTTTLTLNNANIASTGVDATLYSSGLLTILLKNTNTVESSAEIGIRTRNGSLKITAEEDASLSVSGTNFGIQASTSLTISGKATVTAVGGILAISTNGYDKFFTEGNFTIYAGADENNVTAVNIPGANKYVSIEPTTAPAVTEYDVYVGGVRVTSENAGNVLGDGKVSYVPATKTLTLNGATIEVASGSGITSYDDLTIKLTGTNTVTNTHGSGINIYNGDLTIEDSGNGNGKLTATGSGDYADGIGTTYGSITISSGTVITSCSGTYARGIYAMGGNVTISGGTVEANGEMRGIYAHNNGNNNHGFITISGGTVTAKGGTVAVEAVSGVSVANYLGSYRWKTTEGGSMTSSGVQEYSYANNGSATYLKIEPLAAAPIVPVTGVTLDATELELSVGGSGTLVATVAPANATNKAVTWYSSDSAVATVDNSGKVTAVAAGDATITVTTEDGSKTATCAVTVTAAAPQYKEYAIHSATLSNVQQVLNGVADVTSNDGVITIKLTSNINGRLDFNNHSGKFVLDMNGKTIDAGTTNEALCLNNGFTGTVKVIGSGTFKTGCNNIVYGGGKLTIGLSEGKDYFTLVKDGTPVFVDVNTGTTALSTFVRGRELVLTQCNGIIRTITFHANGGTGTMAAASALDGTNYTLPSCTFTAPSGKEFKGWATTANGTVLSGTTLAVTANVDLYAIWEETTQGGGNGGGNQGGNNPTPPAPTYPSYNPPVITTPSVDVDDSTLNDAAGALGSAVLDSKAEIVPAAGYTVEKIAKLQSEGKLNLVIDKKASYDAADKALVDAAAAKKAALYTQYLDIDAVLKTDSGEVVATVKNTVKPLTITIALSAEMQQAAKDGKTLLVVRCHEGKCDYLNGTLNAEKTEITIQSAQFSTYAVIAVESDAAKTFDGGVALYGAMALLSVGGGAALVIGKKRKD